MLEELSTADREVLVHIVKLAQKQGLKGTKGEWKEFLRCHDRKFGASLSDPAKRSRDILMAFLETFSRKEDLKFFSNLMRCHENLRTMERLSRDFPGSESPQQKLVRLTVGHPQYVQHYSFPSHDEGWMVIPLGEVSKLANANSMISLDCEMALCEDGTDAVIKVCVVDHNLEVKMNEIVRPDKHISDFRTSITGMCSNDLEGVTCSLVDIQKSLRKLLLHGTILVGHSLHNDLQALKIDHARVIDTAYIFNYVDMLDFRTPSLNNLCKSVLGTELRKDGEPHDCLADAEAAMKIVLAKIKHGFDYPIAVEGKKVSEADLAKLLLHRIPIDVPSEDLLKVFPNYSNITIQPDVKISGQTYSTYAVFKDCKEAFDAYEETIGPEEKDSYGRRQKLVSLRLDKSKTIDIYIRKMSSDSPQDDTVILKRNADAKTKGGELKKHRTDLRECEGHLKEIERLKEELRQRDEEIFNLQRALSDLMEKGAPHIGTSQDSKQLPPPTVCTSPHTGTSHGLQLSPLTTESSVAPPPHTGASFRTSVAPTPLSREVVELVREVMMCMRQDMTKEFQTQVTQTINMVFSKLFGQGGLSSAAQAPQDPPTHNGGHKNDGADDDAEDGVEDLC